MLIISITLYLVLTLLLTLRVCGRVSFSRVVVLFFLVTVSLNILVSEILSLVNALDQPWFFLFTQAFFSIALGFLLWDPRKWIFKQAVPKIQLEGIRPKGLDWMLLTLIVAIFTLSLYIGFLAPINNSDSLHTHLPRIYYWIQHGSLDSWDAVTVTQINKPINLSLQGVWLFLLGGSERLFFLATWFALLTAVVIIYNIARQLGASYRGALLAALTSLSFPVILLQTFSYQADVFVSTFGLASVTFLLEYMREKRAVMLFFSLLPLAVALGSKNTSLFILPFYLLVLLVFFIRERVGFRRILVFGGVFLLLFGVLSSYKFIQNYLERDQLESSMLAIHRVINPPVDPSTAPSATPFTPASGKAEPKTRLITNTMRYLHQGLSVDGLTGRLKLGVMTIRAEVFQSLSERLGVNLEVKQFVSAGDEEAFKYNGISILNEDAAWYGPLSVILVPIACLVVLFGRNKTRKRYLLVSASFLVVVFLMVSLLIIGWSSTNGRYLIMPMLVFSPLLFVLLPARRTAGVLVTIVIALSVGYLAFSSLLINYSRPLITQFSLYSYQTEKLDHSPDADILSRAWTYVNDRVIEDLALTSPDRRDIRNHTYYENLFYQSADDIPDVEFINTHVLPDESLYTYMRKSVIEYALFGINKTRTLHPVKRIAEVPSGALLLADVKLLRSPPKGMSLLAHNAHYSILHKD